MAKPLPEANSSDMKVISSCIPRYEGIDCDSRTHHQFFQLFIWLTALRWPGLSVWIKGQFLGVSLTGGRSRFCFFGLVEWRMKFRVGGGVVMGWEGKYAGLEFALMIGILGWIARGKYGVRRRTNHVRASCHLLLGLSSRWRDWNIRFEIVMKYFISREPSMRFIHSGVLCFRCQLTKEMV